MKKRFLLIALWGLTLSVAYSQKTVKDANAVSRQVSSFHAIEISGGIDLYLSQGNAEAVAVTAENKEDRDRIVTEVENGGTENIFRKEKPGYQLERWPKNESLCIGQNNRRTVGLRRIGCTG